MPLKNRITASIKASLLLILANNNSSTMNGAHNATENGHPRIPPTANQTIPCAVFKPPLQFIKAANPRNVVHIAKLDGKKDADEWNMPGLKIKAIM